MNGSIKILNGFYIGLGVDSSVFGFSIIYLQVFMILDDSRADLYGVVFINVFDCDFIGLNDLSFGAHLVTILIN